MIWDPDCKGPCDCPGEEVKAKPLDQARRNLEAIVIRCREGDKRSDWLPVIDRLATEALEALKPTPVVINCSDHKPVQHRDHKPPWCNRCGRAANGELIGRPKCRHPIDAVNREALCTDCGVQL